MKKYVVLSVNENPQYLFYMPIVIWAWRHFGWEPIIFSRQFAPKSIPENCIWSTFGYIDKAYSLLLFHCNQHDGYKSETIAQVSRLYGACVVDQDSYLMTSDIDMLPLSDFWKPNMKNITVWGHDLCSFNHYPICYIGMPHDKWVQVMGLTDNDYDKLIKRDLDTQPQAKSTVNMNAWFTDQDLITAKIKATQFEKDFVNRGTYQYGHALHRVDRGSWRLDHDRFIDCHMLRDIYKNPKHFDMTMELLRKIWPNEDFTWFKEYTEEFKRIVNG